MKKEILEQEVLAMYDVRGIQDYIFKSNAVKEIIGASALVEQIITDGLKEYIDSLEDTWKEKYLNDWMHDDPYAFLKDPSVEMQVLFVGGGNACVLFRKGKQCQQATRFLGRYLLEHTYSLRLAAAFVKKTESYQEDYANISEEIRRVKAAMPYSMPAGVMPFMAADPATGYPLTFEKQGAFFSTEAMLKRRAFPRQEDEKVFDHMVTEKGDSSILAVCHIDGNEIGKMIRNKMQGILNYGEAILCMRRLFCEIAAGFRAAVDKMKGYMDSLALLVKQDTGHKLYREIIAAGDDITFVCNAKLAIPAVEYFLKHIGEEGDFSACGGISYFNSHFPFSDAYQVAEACCENAKKKAKQKENRGDQGQIGNYLDFQICTNIRASVFELYRNRHYRSEDGLFIARPYYIPVLQDICHLNERNEKYSIEKLKYWSSFFHKMPRNKAKHLRNIIPVGKNELQKEISFLNSRGYCQFAESEKEYRIWYDALELMDWFIEEDREDGNKDKASE